MEGLVRFAGTVLKLTLVIEGIGAAILTLRWWPVMGFGQALWHGVFHAVSAFNNAGFALWSDNLSSWRGDVTVNLVITGLIIAGGLGFFVWAELIRPEPAAGRASRCTRAWCWSPPRPCSSAARSPSCCSSGTTRGRSPALPVGERVLAAWFQSVTARTAGFNTIDIGAHDRRRRCS